MTYISTIVSMVLRHMKFEIVVFLEDFQICRWV